MDQKNTPRRTWMSITRLSALIVLSLVVALAAAAALPGVAWAIPPEHNPDKITPAALTAADPCATLNWVNPTGGAVSVRMLLGTSLKQSSTPVARLTFSDLSVSYAYCTDLHHYGYDGHNYCVDPDAFSDWRVAWLASNYPPTLISRTDQAAQQAAIWHFSDGYDLDQADPTTNEDAGVDLAVKTHYNNILAAMPPEQPPEYIPGNMAVSIDPAADTSFLPGGEVHPFTVTVTKGGLPQAGQTVDVSATFGVLDKTSAVTDANGEAFFTLTSSTAGTAQITAKTTVNVPPGSLFDAQINPDTEQRLILAGTEEITIQGVASKTWLSADNVIIAHKYEDYNFNKVQDAGEPNLSSWTFTLTLPDASQSTALTNAAGDAYFYNKIGPDGSYTLAETLISGWINTTPLAVSKVRSAANAWNQWGEAFGNARYSIITVVKFNDLDGDGIWDEALEPALPNWQFQLDQKDSNGLWQQFRDGSTGADGSLSFTALPAATYRVVELTQVGWTNTTLLEQKVVLASNSQQFAYFGNRQLMDYGDLPVSYGVTSYSDDGARHIPDGVVFLGNGFDLEADGLASSLATGDNTDNLDDENGAVRIANPTDYWTAGSGSVDVTASAPGCLFAWMDVWNTAANDVGADQDFNDSGNGWSELILDNVPVSAGVNHLSFSLPVDAATYPVFARFRIVPQVDGTCNPYDTSPVLPTGLQVGGEVEDFVFTFDPSAISLSTFNASTPAALSKLWIWIVSTILAITAGGMAMSFFRLARSRVQA